jgi:hypothetical protein
MKNHSWLYLTILTFSSFNLSLEVAYADEQKFPFNPDPISFTKYLNSLSWKDGEKHYFQNLGKCLNGRVTNSYMCERGYITTTSPMGTKVCAFTGGVFSMVSYSSSAGATYFTLNQDCRYK